MFCKEEKEPSLQKRRCLLVKTTIFMVFALFIVAFSYLIYCQQSTSHYASWGEKDFRKEASFSQESETRHGFALQEGMELEAKGLKYRIKRLLGIY
jgi:hypothetical protein